MTTVCNRSRAIGSNIDLGATESSGFVHFKLELDEGA